MTMLKVKPTKTEDIAEVEYAKKHGQIVHTQKGSYDLLLPTDLTEELKPYISKDFDMDIVEEGDALNVIITQANIPKPKTDTNQASIPIYTIKEVLQNAEEY